MDEERWHCANPIPASPFIQLVPLDVRGAATAPSFSVSLTIRKKEA